METTGGRRLRVRQGNPCVVGRLGDHRVFPPAPEMRGDPLEAAGRRGYPDLQALFDLPHLHLSAGQLPRDRIAARAIAHVGVPRHFPRLHRQIRIRRPPRDRREAPSFLGPRFIDPAIGRPMHPTVRHRVDPAQKSRPHLGFGSRLPPEHFRKEVRLQVTDSTLNLSFGLGPVFPAQSRLKAPMPREVREPFVPDDLAPVVSSQSHRLHPVVQNLLAHPSQCPKRALVKSKQRLQTLIRRHIGVNRSRIAQRHHEAIELPSLPPLLQPAQIAPVELRLTPRLGLEPSHRHRSCILPMRLQILLDQSVSARVATLSKLSKQNHRVPYSRLSPLLQILPERSQFAPPLTSRAILRRPVRLLAHILPDRVSR